jgi:hypothetical protein
MITDPFVFKVLDLSTAHMTPQDNKRLEAEVHEGQAPVYELKAHGWLVYVGEIEDNWPAVTMSEAFRNVLKEAKELGCDYVRFDRDGRTYEELPVFDW